MLPSFRRGNLTKQMDINNWEYVEEKQSQSLTNPRSTEADGSRRNTHPLMTGLGVYKWLLMFFLCAAVVSIPWEFMRLYQKAVAERASKIVQGTPPECSPENMTLFQRIKSFLVSQFSWTHARRPCQEYYYALLVDPLWEVTPAMVLISVFTRCCLHPVELIAGSLGNSLQLFFSEIPSQWQPFIFLIATVIILVLLLMLFGYRLSIPLFLRLESRSPIRRQTYLRNDNYSDEIARKTDRNIYCDERTPSLLGKTAPGNTARGSVSRIRSEVGLQQDRYVPDSKPDQDCRKHDNQEDSNNNNFIQTYIDDSLMGSVTKKQNVRDSWKLPVSEILTGKTQKEKHQTLYKSRKLAAINVIKTNKSTIPLNSRKRSETKKKPKLDSLWTPRHEDYISSDSE